MKWNITYTENWGEAMLLAQEGWELVSVCNEYAGPRYYFKKLIK